MLALMAAPTSKPRSTSQVVATKPACLPLLEMYRAAVVARPRSWSAVKDAFVSAMETFDANVASGVADIGDLQNGKGDFLNDLLALLLEGCEQRGDRHVQRGRQRLQAAQRGADRRVEGEGA